VEQALAALRRAGECPAKAHLEALGRARTGSSGKEVVPVDALGQDRDSGLTFRALQALALKEHVTQRDAAPIGVTRLARQPSELYQVLFWELPGSPQQYLK
jgi:hypothetical protein